jgi:hypothetical protein
VILDGGESLLPHPSHYFAASVFAAARAFAASDIFFRVAAEITLFFAGAAAFTAADFLAAVDFFADDLASGLAERTYFRF